MGACRLFFSTSRMPMPVWLCIAVRAGRVLRLLLPEPVSPTTTVVAWVSTRYRTCSRCRAMGRLPRAACEATQQFRRGA